MFHILENQLKYLKKNIIVLFLSHSIIGILRLVIFTAVMLFIGYKLNFKSKFFEELFSIFNHGDYSNFAANAESQIIVIVIFIVIFLGELFQELFNIFNHGDFTNSVIFIVILMVIFLAELMIRLIFHYSFQNAFYKIALGEKVEVKSFFSKIRPLRTILILIPYLFIILILISMLTSILPLVSLALNYFFNFFYGGGFINIIYYLIYSVCVLIFGFLPQFLIFQDLKTPNKSLKNLYSAVFHTIEKNYKLIGILGLCVFIAWHIIWIPITIGFLLFILPGIFLAFTLFWYIKLMVAGVYLKEEENLNKNIESLNLNLKKEDFTENLEQMEELSIKEAEHKAKIEIAQKMLAQGLPLEEISSFTGLSIEEIKELTESSL